MATTQQYLEQLIKDKNALINAYKERNVDVAENATFTDLAGMSGSLPTGGGEPPIPDVVFTGHFDTDGLTELGYSQSDIEWYRDNGVAWDSEYDDYYKYSPSDLTETNNAMKKFIPANTTINYYDSYRSLLAIPSTIPKPSTGNYMFRHCTALTTMPSFDFAGVTQANNMFQFCRNLKKVPEIDTSSVTSFCYAFNGCSNLEIIPELDYSNCTNFSYTFYECRNLKKIPENLNFNNGSDYSFMFTNCCTLKKAPTISPINNNVNMNSIFAGCCSLTDASNLDTSKASNLTAIFDQCYALVKTPLIDCTKATSLQYAFSSCYSLEEIEFRNSRNVTNMGSIFYGCYTLKRIKGLDTTSASNMSSMFNQCAGITNIPAINTAYATDMGNMFNNCYSLKSLPQLDCTKALYVQNMLANCSGLKYLGGFLNLGSAYLTTRAELYNSYAMTLSACQQLTHDSLMNVINNLYDIASKGVKAQRLALSSVNIAKLTNEEIAVATSKGWTVS